MKRSFTIMLTLFLTISVFGQIKRVTILSVNDIHSSIDHFPHLAAIIDSMRTVDPQLIVLSAGDNRTGNPYNDCAELPGFPVIEMMNYMKFNASAVGNHDWDGCWVGLREIVNNADFPFLCSNATLPDSMRLHLYPYRFINANGARIGILGTLKISALGIPECDPDCVNDIKFTHSRDVIPQYQWMRQQCDAFILLSHDGYDDDQKTAERYPWIDAIVGGHSHTLVSPNTFHNGVLVTQAKNKLAYASVIKLDIRDGKVVNKSSELIDIRHFSHENPQVRLMVDQYHNNPTLHEVVGHLDTDLEDVDELGSLLCDSYREELNCDIAIQNGGGVRLGSLNAGDISIADVLMLDPFSNTAIVYEMSGHEVADFIMGCHNVDEHQLPFVAGITYTMKLGPNGEAVGITIKQLNGKKFDLNARYRLVTNSYVAKINQFRPQDAGTNTRRICSDLMLQYLKKKVHVNYRGVHRISAKK